MKFPRNARIFRGHLDAAPFAIVFACLALFLLLGTLVYTPGVALQLPLATGLPGTDKPTPIAVALDGNGRFYFENKRIEESELRARLKQAASQSKEPLTLLVKADKTVNYDQLIRLALLARDVGVPEAWLATLPGPAPAKRSTP